MTRQPRYRIVLADDHAMVAEGLARLLEADFDLVARVDNGQKAVHAVRSLRPDAVLLDISMPVLNGIDAARNILAEDRSAKVIFITMHTDPIYVREAFRLGGCGYVLKRSAASEIVAAIEAVMAGQRYLTPLLPELSHFTTGPYGAGVEPLTFRQREVLQLVAEGRTAKEIGTLLNISIKTAEFHKQNLMRKLGAHTVVELTRYALEHRILAE